MNLTLAQLQKTAALAYLDSRDAEALLNETNLILNEIDRIHKVDVTGIEPLVHPIEAYQFLREDTVSHHNAVEALAKAAPHFVDNHYLVPQHMKDR